MPENSDESVDSSVAIQLISSPTRMGGHLPFVQRSSVEEELEIRQKLTKLSDDQLCLLLIDCAVIIANRNQSHPGTVLVDTACEGFPDITHWAKAQSQLRGLG